MEVNSLEEIAPRRERNSETGRMEGEHSITFGTTGFGKTFFNKRLYRLRKYVAVIDAKGTMREPGFVRYEKLDQLFRSKAHKLIYAPNRRELRDESAINEFFEWCYLRGNTTVGVDELTAHAIGRREMPEALYDLYARGREFGNEVWANTQEPVYVPNIALTQARNFYCFYIANEAHRKKVCAHMPGLTMDAIAALPKRAFYYYREGMRTSIGPFTITAHGAQDDTLKTA